MNRGEKLENVRLGNRNVIHKLRRTSETETTAKRIFVGRLLRRTNLIAKSFIQEMLIDDDIILRFFFFLCNENANERERERGRKGNTF